MLNPKLKLPEHIFTKPDEKPTRDGFGKGLLELGETNPNVVALCAGGADRVDNMQWLSVDAHRVKSRSDRKTCRQIKTAALPRGEL